MKPEELAINHSKIIDAKLKLLHEVFAVVKNDVSTHTANVFNSMVIDDKGLCTNCKENRAMVNKALGYVRIAFRKQRPVINSIYGDGVMQIEMLATAYINWLQHG